MSAKEQLFRDWCRKTGHDNLAICANDMPVDEVTVSSMIEAFHGGYQAGAKLERQRVRLEMRIAKFFLVVTTALLVFLLITGIGHAKQPIRVIEGMVTKVSDGDTIQVTDALDTKVKVRMYGIDAPETEKGNKRTGKVSKAGQPYGEEAFRALQQKVGRQRVRLDVMDIDRYGRTVSIVWLSSRNINREMVAEGWAWAYRDYLDRAHASEYINAENQARREGKGLWQQGRNIQPPWEFRRLQR